MLLTSFGLLKDVLMGQDTASVKDVIEGTFGSKDEIKGKASNFAKSPAAGIATALVGYYAMSSAIQWASDKWDLSYDSAIKNTSESNSGVQTAVSDLDSLISKQGVDNINDMITKINSQKGFL